MASRAPYIVPALTKHTATVIMTHGLGDRYASRFNQYALNEWNKLTGPFFNKKIAAQAGKYILHSCRVHDTAC